MRRFFILILLLIGGLCVASSQSHNKDEKAEKDSTSLYDNIYKLSQKNRFNKFIYDLLFKQPETKRNDSVQSPPLPYLYKDSEKKVIRKIIIVNKAPFDIDDNDINEFSAKRSLNKTANFLHVNTRSFIIKNLLLFKEKQAFDSLLIQESERLIRSQPYVEKSLILGVNAENSTDSVDVYVVVKDKLSIFPEAQVTSSRFGIGLKEMNLLGFGHQAHVYYAWNYGDGIDRYQYDYKIPNLLNTYINTGVIYSRSITDGNETKHFYAERPFYSPLTKLAGGVTLMQQSQVYNVNIPNTDNFIGQGFKYNIYDVWGAYAFNLKSRNALKARTRKLVLSARYYHIDYPVSPPAEYDPLSVYSKENLYLIGVGVSRRKYNKDSYLFRYGFTEDVPTGYNYSIIGGLQHKNDKNRLYVAAKLSAGRYFKPGYFSGSVEYGSFFDNGSVNQGVFTAEVNYFTPLLEIRDWKIRQFIKPQYMIGINRLETDRLSLQDYFGISGFNSPVVTGTQKFVCNFQTQVFTPWNLWGFKLAPYFIYSMGMLGNQKTGFAKSKVYSLFGLGFLIRNDYLVFNSFEVSVSFYPYIPQSGSNIFRFNAYEASDFRFRDFDIKKPEQVIYR